MLKAWNCSNLSGGDPIIGFEGFVFLILQEMQKIKLLMSLVLVVPRIWIGKVTDRINRAIADLGGRSRERLEEVRGHCVSDLNMMGIEDYSELLLSNF